MRWQCPNCKAVLKITEPSRFSGPGPITVKCPKCGQTLQIELPNVSEGGSLMPSVPMTAITSAPLETTETAVSTDLPGHSLTAQPPLLTTLIRIWRWAPSSLMTLSILMFFAPWTEINCSGHRLISETGFQAFYGGYSFSSKMHRLDREMRRQEARKIPVLGRPELGMIKEMTNRLDEGKEGLFAQCALLLIFSFVLLLAAIVASVLMPQAWRPWSVAGILIAALLSLIIQLFIGLPLDYQWSNLPQNLHVTGTRADPSETAGLLVLAIFGPTYTIWVWLVLFLWVLACGLEIAEGMSRLLARRQIQ